MKNEEPALGENLVTLLTTVLTEGKDIKELMARPWSVADKLGVTFSAGERRFLKKLPMRSYIKQLYSSLSEVDKRYKRALQADDESKAIQIPPALVIPIVGVMVCCVIVAIIIVAGPESGVIEDESPDRDRKL